MRNKREFKRLELAQKAFLAMAGSAIGISACGEAKAGGVPTWSPGEAGVFTQDSGSPEVAGSPVQEALPISSTTPTLTRSTITFPFGGGNTIAAAGLQHTESTTSTRITIASGTGISQTDTNSAETASSLEVFYDAQWAVPAGGFGVPIAGNFTLPIGTRVGAGGSASATVKIDWDYVRGGSEFGFSEFTKTDSWNNTTNATMNVLTSIVAPTVFFTPNQLQAGDTLIITGDITFTADADDPTVIEVPTAYDFYDLGVTSDQIGFSSVDVVPEPGATMLMAIGASGLLLYRQPRARPESLPG